MWPCGFGPNFGEMVIYLSFRSRIPSYSSVICGTREGLVQDTYVCHNLNKNGLRSSVRFMILYPISIPSSHGKLKYQTHTRRSSSTNETLTVSVQANLPTPPALLFSHLLPSFNSHNRDLISTKPAVCFILENCSNSKSH